MLILTPLPSASLTPSPESWGKAWCKSPLLPIKFRKSKPINISKKRLISQPFFACMREALVKCGKALLAPFESGIICDDVV